MDTGGMLKRSGAACPACWEQCPAEYAQMGQAPRWSCLKCGSGGPLLGEFTGRKAAAAPPPQAKKHWSSR